MKQKALMLAILFALCSIPLAYAGNQVIVQDAVMYNQPYPQEFSELNLSTTDTRYICGYSLDREDRGDCQSLGDILAPGERWYKLSLPSNSAGNAYQFFIENLDDPHYVDLSVNICKSNSYYSPELLCRQYDDMYTITEQTIIVYPQIVSEYWIHIIAWDEEKEGRNPSGDLTLISVTAEKLDIMVQSEPRTLDYDNIVYGVVCAVGCDEGLADPMDIFVIEGWEGDVIGLEFGSNEGDVNPDYGVHVYIKFETQFFSSDQFSYFKLDDSCDTSNDGDCRVMFSYQFEQSGDLYVSFYSTQGSDTVADEEVEDYWIFSTYSDSLRDEDADLDKDGLPDYMEYLCLSDFRDPNDTAPDYDGDKACDLVDLDDDNDGMSDYEEQRCGSDPLDSASIAPNNDGDMLCDEFDPDDDNDGMLDGEEQRCGSDSFDSASIAPDNDGDTFCDEFDDDDDNDGITDIEESSCGSDPMNRFEIPLDFDVDGTCDSKDIDLDGDGVENSFDGCNFTSYTLIWSEVDLDSDGCFTSEDDDWDGDGVDNDNDDCKLELANSNQVNSTGCIIPVVVKASFTEIVVDYTVSALIYFVICYIFALIATLVISYINLKERDKKHYSLGKGLVESIGKINYFLLGIIIAILDGISWFIKSLQGYYRTNIKKKGACIGCDEVLRVMSPRAPEISNSTYPFQHMLPNDRGYNTEAPICDKHKAIIQHAVSQLREALSLHQKHTLPKLNAHRNKQIGNVQSTIITSGIEEQIASQLIESLEVEIKDNLYTDLSLVTDFSNSGYIEKIKWRSKSGVNQESGTHNLYLTSKSNVDENVEKNHLLLLRADYREEADKIAKHSENLELKAVESVITKASHYGILQDKISDYSNMTYQSSIKLIFQEYAKKLKSITNLYLRFEEIAGTKSLRSSYEAQANKSNKKIKDVYQNDKIGYTTNLEESIKQTIIKYCKSNKITNQLSTNMEYEQFIAEAENILGAELKKIEASIDWTKKELNWSEISGLPFSPIYADINDLRKKVSEAVNEASQVKKIRKRAKDLGLNLPKSKHKDLLSVKKLFEQEYTAEKTKVKQQIEQEHGSLRDYQENLGLEELRDNLYRLNELPKLLRAGLPPRVAESFVEMRITESVVMMLGTAFGPKDGVMIPWENHILDTLGLTPESNAWSDSHFMIDGVERQSKESINRIVEFIKRTEDGKAFDYAIKHGGENFSLDDFDFLVRCVNDPTLQPLYINIELGIIDFATAKSAIIDYELDQIPDAHDAIQKIAEGEDLELTAAKYKQYQI